MRKEKQCICCGKLTRNLKYCNNSCSAKDTNKKRAKEKYCLYCETSIKGTPKKYCSHDCQHNYQYNEYIKKWKQGKESGIRGDSTSTRIRKYLFNKYENKCSKCGWGEKNIYTNKIPLEIEHIDGNYKNNKEENLDLLCPNCHSLTSTHGSLNIGNGKRDWKNKYRKKYKEKYLELIGENNESDV